MKIKEIAQVRNKMSRLIENLGPSKTLLILQVCCVLFGLIILIFVYTPLMIKLHSAANKLHEVQTELLNQHSAIAALEKLNAKGEMIQRNEVSLAIAELTEKGRSLGLRFSSIAQQPLQEITQADIQKLPISFTIESEYKNTGQFLTFIEEFSNSIVEVESLSIRPGKNNPSELSVELVLNLYVEI